MRRRSTWFFVALLASVMLLAAAVPARAAKFRILVGNDDGFGAPGIAELVKVLTADSSLDVSVYAPATNQSGTGDRYTNGPLTVTSAQTSDGYPAFSVAGYPADGILFGVLQGLPQRPDLVITGINQGQNVGDLVNISGTVGAALAAARLGIPAFAVSQALGPNISYTVAAQYTYDLVNRFRGSATFRSRLRGIDGRPHILNINFPTCATGKLRGIRAVPLGRTQKVVGYEQGSSANVWNPVVITTPVGSTNCDSTLRVPATDLEALNNGFGSVTPLNIDLTNDETIHPITRFVEQ
jgi:5'-nucleotidase